MCNLILTHLVGFDHIFDVFSIFETVFLMMCFNIYFLLLFPFRFQENQKL